MHHIAVGRLGGGELDGHIGPSESFAVEVVGVVDVNNAHYLVATLASYLLYHVAHLAIAYDCYFHCYTYLIILTCKDTSKRPFSEIIQYPLSYFIQVSHAVRLSSYAMHAPCRRCQ